MADCLYWIASATWLERMVSLPPRWAETLLLDQASRGDPFGNGCGRLSGSGAQLAQADCG